MENYVILKRFSWGNFGIYEYPGTDIGFVLGTTLNYNIDLKTYATKFSNKKEIIVLPMSGSDKLLMLSEMDIFEMGLTICNEILDPIGKKIYKWTSSERILADNGSTLSNNSNNISIKIMGFKEGDEIDTSGIKADSISIINDGGISLVRIGNSNLTIAPLGYEPKYGSPFNITFNASSGKIEANNNFSYFLNDFTKNNTNQNQSANGAVPCLGGIISSIIITILLGVIL